MREQQEGMNQRRSFLNSIKDVAANLLIKPDSECVICFIEFKDSDQVVQLPCSHKHIYHFECLDAWI